MRLALAEASKGVGLTAPNPAVGAVIVKDGEVLATGWHRRAGQPHAERDALARMGDADAAGGCIYVTLEPCSTHGRTGACSDAIIAAGLARCVYAMDDPNPAHAGRGRTLLEAAGLEVDSGVLEVEAQTLVRGFSQVQRTGRPWVVAKTAMTLDGRITRPPGESQWLSSPASRCVVQRLRCEVDAIVTGGETIRADDPAFTLRGPDVPEGKEQPWRVVMTRRGIERGYRIFTDEWRERTLVYEGVEPEDVLKGLAERGVNTVLLESGGELMGAFIDAGLVDEWVAFLAPLVTGGDKCGVAGSGAQDLSTAQTLGAVRFEQIGDDVVAYATVLRGESGRPGLQDAGGVA